MEQFQIHIKYQDSIKMIDLEKILHSFRSIYAYQMEVMYGIKRRQITDNLHIKSIRSGSIVVECLNFIKENPKMAFSIVHILWNIISQIIRRSHNNEKGDNAKTINSSNVGNNNTTNNNNGAINIYNIIINCPNGSTCVSKANNDIDLPPHVIHCVKDFISVLQHGIVVSIRVDATDEMLTIGMDGRFNIQISIQSASESGLN